jgi:apolipoprotein N-acyltransferase
MSVLTKILDNRPPWQIAFMAGLFLVIGWSPLPTFFFLFIGIFLLLVLEEKLSHASNKKFILLFYTAHFIWNLGTTWWVYKASLGGAIFMIFANSLLQLSPWILYRLAKKTVGNKRSLFMWVCFYIGFEHFHHTWDLAWPWLTLGNSLGSATPFAQFYQFTGVAGGSLWILLGASVLFHHYKNRVTWLTVGITILLPAIISIILYSTAHDSNDKPLKVGIIQPNFEPHFAKFEIDPINQLDTIIMQMEIVAKQGAELIVLPETALVQGFNEGNKNQNQMVRMLKKFIQKHPTTAIIGGTDSYRLYDEKTTPTARQSAYDSNLFYDVYNTAFYLDSSGLNPQLYHKAKLVPGTEIMPYPGLLSFLDKVMISLDGTPNSLGRDFKIFNYELANTQKIAPSICYESIFGDWTAQFVRQGANYIAIMSNDGWWGQTYGYQQLLDYGKLRAIENKRWIVRSGNTGISGIISPKGKLINGSKFWKRTQIVSTIYANNRLTLYTKWGDFINRTLFLVSLFIIPGILVRRVLNKKEKKKNIT